MNRETPPNEPDEQPPRTTEDDLKSLKPPGLFREFYLFLKEEKAWWMAPIILVLLLAGALIILGAVAQPYVPFLYPLF
jgi:hypothetical protein